ncbi:MULTISPECIES: DUF2933 domain-containing protein [unclassified Pseudomonas]|uniref:DUF2933 domain-containing protein n=1 Tax=unclassified Pseudomonas TaxID=196821 RepID=UPI00129EF93D|nr:MULTISPECIES: DUF2933 domain-containing protein [unclassified Pseudomonas]MDH4653871.1 DUF2933 domain-containing protein [Pseudomonas sp. BN606]MRK22724.1 DUF2933 domain-containing protein [Pseudomonas sp. JG-B]
MNPHFDEHGSPPSFWRSRYAIGLVVIGGVAVYFLLTEHFAHVVGALPYLLLLACPLMHVFMHRGHRGGHHQGQGKPAPFRKTDTRKPGDPS